MTKLDDLTPNAAVKGILPDCMVTVVSVKWFGTDAVELMYKDPGGKPGNTLLYCSEEPRLEVAAQGRPWSFDCDGALFRLVSEAQRIRLAHLFDPVLAVHTSQIDPCPHQITSSASPCCRASLWTPAPARPSWRACSSRNSSLVGRRRRE